MMMLHFLNELRICPSFFVCLDDKPFFVCHTKLYENKSFADGNPHSKLLTVFWASQSQASIALMVSSCEDFSISEVKVIRRR